MNCWEFIRCGREKGGKKEKELGTCPAWPNHGKACARVEGTLCCGTIHSSFAQKLRACMNCDFYYSNHYRREFGIQTLGSGERGGSHDIP